jgi:hypothetical protein
MEETMTKVSSCFTSCNITVLTDKYIIPSGVRCMGSWLRIEPEVFRIHNRKAEYSAALFSLFVWERNVLFNDTFTY